MHDELNDIASNWRNMPEFKECCDLINTLPADAFDEHSNVLHPAKATTYTQIQNFFKEYLVTFDKHFKCWREKLLPLVIASSNARAVTIFAKWYLGEEQIIDENEMCNDELGVHACTFQYSHWLRFLSECCKREDWLCTVDRPGLQKLANGISFMGR